MKPRLRLSYPHQQAGAELYRVESCHGTIDYHPRQMLGRDEVLAILERSDLRLTIVPPPPKLLTKHERQALQEREINRHLAEARKA